MKSYNKTRSAPVLYASATFYDDAPEKVGSMAGIECYENAFHVVKLNWGAEEDYERSIDGEVELCWTVTGEGLQCLMQNCNNAKTPDEVVNYLKERFAQHGKTAHYELLQWLDEKQIPYFYNEY